MFQMKFYKIFTELKFDPLTFLITTLILPAVVALVAILRRQFKPFLTSLIEGIFLHVFNYLGPKVARALTLRWYCRIRLAGENRYLHVPSRTDTKLEIDRVYVTLTLERSGTS